jgi:hypothetical protein
MEEFKRDFEDVKRDARAYAEAEVALFKVRAISKVTEILATVISRYIIVLSALVPIFFALMALGFYLSELLNDMALGFLAVAGISLVIMIILMAFRKAILTYRIQDVIINEISDLVFDPDEN